MSVTRAPMPRAILAGVGTDDASTDDADVAGWNSGDSTEEDAAAAALFFEVGGSDLDGHAAGDFAHGGKERECAGAVADCFVCYAGDLLVEQRVGEVGQRGKVEVGEEDEAFAEVAVLFSTGSLTLTIMSARRQTSWYEPTISAPADWYSSSGMAERVPALCSTRT